EEQNFFIGAHESKSPAQAYLTKDTPFYLIYFLLGRAVFQEGKTSQTSLPPSAEGHVERSFRVGLLGMYGSNNLGDTSIQMAVMQAIRRRIPKAGFFGFSWSARDVANTHHIPAFAA